jgi:SAM-dependent methyltransferase
MSFQIYDHPNYYDIGFGWDPSKELDFLEACFRKYCPSRVGRVLELGCGTGRLLIGLAERGYEVVGVEINRLMIEFAASKSRRMGIQLQIVESDMASFDIVDKVDAAFCAIDTFRYLPNEEAARNHLKCVGKVLRPNGLYIIDLTILGSEDSDLEHPEEWTIERGGVRVTVAHSRIGLPDVRNRRTLEEMSLTVAEDGVTRKFEDKTFMRTYTMDQFESLLESVEIFRVLSCHSPRFEIDQLLMPGPETQRIIVVLKRL